MTLSFDLGRPHVTSYHLTVHPLPFNKKQPYIDLVTLSGTHAKNNLRIFLEMMD